MIKDEACRGRNLCNASGRQALRVTGGILNTQIDIERATYEDKLVREHLALVQYVVSEIVHRVPNHVSRNDLVSAGMLGLAQAARSFDAERGIAFDRFASTRIRGALLDELRGRDWASRSVRAKARGLQAANDELTNKLGRPPSPDEVARELGVEAEAVHKLVDDVHRATVLNYDSLVLEGDAESFLATGDAGPEDTLLDRERKAYLIDAIEALPERLRHVVVAYFYEERSMQEIADELGVTESRISQLRSEAMAAAPGRHQLAARPRRARARGSAQRSGGAPEGRLLRGRRGAGPTRASRLRERRDTGRRHGVRRQELILRRRRSARVTAPVVTRRRRRPPAPCGPPSAGAGSDGAVRWGSSHPTCHRADGSRSRTRGTPRRPDTLRRSPRGPGIGFRYREEHGRVRAATLGVVLPVSSFGDGVKESHRK